MPEPVPAEAATRAVRPLSVHVLLEGRRKPVAIVRLAIGPLEVVLSVSHLKKWGLAARPPMVDGGAPAVSAAPEVWAVIEKATVAAAAGDPVTREHVLGKLLERVSEPSMAPGPASS